MLEDRETILRCSSLYPYEQKKWVKGVGRIVWWVEHSPCKQGDLSSDPQHLCIKPNVVVCARNFSAVELEAGGYMEPTDQPAC